MITGHDIYDFLKKLLGHPIFKFVYPFIFAGIGILLIKEGKSMGYLESSSHKLSSSLTAKERKILGESVDSVYYGNFISIYNDGDGYIDNSDFIDFEQITVSKLGANIKGAYLYKTSREQLDFDIYLDPKTRDLVVINIMNNEVFEENDVAIIKVLYTNKSENDWIVKSRIKGMPSGILKSDIKQNEKQIIKWLVIILIGITIILLFRFILFRIKRMKFVIRNIELYPILTFLGVAGILLYEYIQDQKIIEHLIF